MTEEDHRQDKKMPGKTDKLADQWNDKKTDFLENPNWLKKIKDKTRHCLERLINRWVNEITIWQISPKSILTEEDNKQDKALPGKLINKFMNKITTG